MSDTKPKEYGFPTPKPRVVKKPVLPRVLQSINLSGGLRPAPPSEEQCKIYGKWKLRALKGHGIGYGTLVQPGDTYWMDGANAVCLVCAGQAEFVDPKVAEEARVMEEAKKLGLDRPPKIRDLEAFKEAERVNPNPWRNSGNS